MKLVLKIRQLSLVFPALNEQRQENCEQDLIPNTSITHTTNKQYKAGPGRSSPGRGLA